MLQKYFSQELHLGRMGLKYSMITQWQILSDIITICSLFVLFSFVNLAASLLIHLFQIYAVESQMRNE